MLTRAGALALGAAVVLVSCASRGAIPANQTPPVASGARYGSPIAIAGTGANAKLDGLVRKFMIANLVPNAQLAVWSGGKISFSHAYTYVGVAASTTTTATLMRLASNTKAWTSAAIYTLIQAGKIQKSTYVFPYLGITKPLPATAKVDPQVMKITVWDLVQGYSQSGWNPARDGDPSFEMRKYARALGLKHYIDRTSYVRYGITKPIRFKPGTKGLYCNFCFDVLGMVVAKASGMSFIDYLQKHVSDPSGGGPIAISPTVGTRLPGEVAAYYNPNFGYSAYRPQSDVLTPCAYGGDGGVLEVAQGDGGAATSAETMLALMNHFIIWGPGPPGKPQWRSGEIAGTETWAAQLSNGTNFAFDVNSNAFGYVNGRYSYGGEQSFVKLQEHIAANLCGNAAGCGTFDSTGEVATGASRHPTPDTPWRCD